MRYGVPYKGSKNAICGKLAEAIPWKGIDNFYDLFAGGCAMTHKMMLNGHYSSYHANDLDGQGLRLFVDAASGKYHDERRWISREDFFRLKDGDPYVACCWSFGNDQRSYLYSKGVEPWKKALHHARVLGDFSLMEAFGIHTGGSRADIKAHQYEYRRKYIRWWLSRQRYTAEELDDLIAKCKTLQSLQRLQSLERLERLQRLQSLERLQSFTVSYLDYREVEIRPNSVIYCDPPYIGTDEYRTGGFDHEAFYNWCCKQRELVLVSEYQMPEDRFEAVLTLEKTSLMSQKGSSSKVQEKLYVPRHQLEMYQRLMYEQDKPRYIEGNLF